MVEFVVGICLLVTSVAAMVLLVRLASPANDPGPWWFDARLDRFGQCRYRSRSTERRCARRDGHHGAHDSDDGSRPARFDGQP